MREFSAAKAGEVINELSVGTGSAILGFMLPHYAAEALEQVFDPSHDLFCAIVFCRMEHLFSPRRAGPPEIIG